MSRSTTSQIIVWLLARPQGLQSENPAGSDSKGQPLFSITSADTTPKKSTNCLSPQCPVEKKDFHDLAFSGLLSSSSLLCTRTRSDEKPNTAHDSQI